jgi:hypothetical protein
MNYGLVDDSICFFVDSDIQYGCADQEGSKRDHVEAMKNWSSMRWPDSGQPIQRPQFCMVTGDLTHNAFCGRLNFMFFPISMKSIPDELRMLQSRFIDPIEASGIQVKLCAGNHDVAPAVCCGRQPILSFIERRHGSRHYYFEVGGLCCVVADLFPSAKICEWIRETVFRAVGPATPLVFFFHYPPTGEMSDWWDACDKDEFARVTRERRTLAIFCGHLHRSEVQQWQGIPCYNTGGGAFACVRYSKVFGLRAYFHDGRTFVPIAAG